MADNNAVVKRIDRLTRHWLSFAELPDARVLRLKLTSDAARLLDGFLAFHNEPASDLEDLFLPVVLSAAEPDEYGNAVRRQILDDIEQAKGDLESLELPTDWQPPAAAADRTPAENLVAVLASFQAYYADLFEHVALVLLPKEIASPQAWIDCLQPLLQISPWPPSVRVVVADWLPVPILDDWSSRNQALVHSVTPRLDMPGLPLELLAHVPGTGPGFEFRRLFVQMGAAASTGQTAMLNRLAQRALKIATDQSWSGLAAAVHLLVGSASASSDPKQALQAFRQARQLAAKVNDPSAPKIAITSAFAEAGTLVAGGDFRQAHGVYTEVARQADESGEVLSGLEARRMASYCSEQNGDFDAAWNEGMAAVQLGKKLDADARSNSTLPALLHRLKEMSGRPELLSRGQSLDQHCAELLGNEWTSVLSRTKTLLAKL